MKSLQLTRQRLDATSTSSPIATRTRSRRRTSCSRCSRSSSSRASATSGRTRAPRSSSSTSRSSATRKRLQAAENRLKEFKLKYMGVAGPGRARTIFGRLAKLGDDIENARLELRAAEESRDAYKRELAGETPTFLPETTARRRRWRSRRSTRGSRRRRPSSTSSCASTPISIPTSSARRRVIERARGAAQAGARGAAKGGGGDRAKSRRSRPSAIRCSSRCRSRWPTPRRTSRRCGRGSSSYEAQYAQLKASARLVPQVEAEFAQLNRDYDVQKKTYDDLLARREAATMGVDVQDTGGTQFRVIDPPRVSPQPVAPTRIMLLGVALLARAAAPGLAASFVASEIMPTFHDARDAARRSRSGRSSAWCRCCRAKAPCARRRRSAFVVRGRRGRAVRVVRRGARVRLPGRARRVRSRPMSLIEQAAKRLEELRRAGAELPADATRRRAIRHARAAARRKRADAGSGRPRARRARTQPACRRPARPDRRQALLGAAVCATRRRSRAAAAVDIDLDRLQERGFVTPDAPKSQIADEFRVIKRPIIRNARAAPGAGSGTAISSWSRARCRAKARRSPRSTSR